MRIGSYEVLSELGRGGMGVVFRARSPEGRDVAVKVLAATDEAFEREVRLLASFSLADGFVPVIDTGSERGRRFLVMPFVAGGTLRARMRQGPLPVAEAVSILSSVARAMGRAHERGIVHRDLKPENILFDGAPGSRPARPLVADLGLAKHFRRDVLGASKSAAASETGVIAGTVGYMAPEQLDDANRARPPSDVFAIGAMLYEALTGKRPFEGQGLLGYARALREAPARPSSVRREVPRWLDRAVLRALAHEEEARFADARVFARALVGEAAPGRRRWLILAAPIVVAPLVWVFLPRPVPAPPPGMRAQELVALAMKRIPQGDLQGAIGCATRAIELDPGLALAWAERSRARWGTGDLDGALADATKAIDLDPGLARGWAFRGTARLAKHELEAAIADETKAIELDPKLAFAWMDRGSARGARGDLDGAIADLTKALEIEPGNARALAGRGSAEGSRGDHERALADLTRAIALEPAFAEAWKERGKARFQGGDLDGAIEDLTRAIELAPRLVKAWSMRSDLNRARGDRRGAFEDVSRVLELDPEDALSWALRGSLRYDLGDYDGAIADLTSAIVLDPRAARAWAQRAAARERKRDDEGVIEDATRALDLDPTLGVCWVHRAIAHRQLGHFTRAVADATRAIELDPRLGSAWFTRGLAYLDHDDAKAAIPDLERGLELDPDGPGATDLRRKLAEARKRAR